METETHRGENGRQAAAVQGIVIDDDLGMAHVMAAFFIQKLKKAPIDEILEVMAGKGVTFLDPGFLAQAIDGLVSAKIVTGARGRCGGISVPMYKMRSVIWASAPEMAQVTSNFLADLIASPEAKDLLARLNDAEEEGAGTKKKRELGVANFVSLEVDVEIRDQVLGGQPWSPGLWKLVNRGPETPAYAPMKKKGKKKEVPGTLLFLRNAAGMPIIPVSNIRGWFKNVVRMINVYPSQVDYMAFEPALLKWEGDIGQWSSAVVGERADGRGINDYECLTAADNNVRATLRFSTPAKGFTPPENLVKLMVLAGPESQRGLSNGRSGEFGRFDVVGWRNGGDLRNLDDRLRNVRDRRSAATQAVIDSLLTP